MYTQFTRVSEVEKVRVGWSYMACRGWFDYTGNHFNKPNEKRSVGRPRQRWTDRVKDG